MAQAPEIPVIDVRTIPPYDRHARIFGTLQTLAPGAAMRVVSDHEPRPLQFQIMSRYPDEFSWDYLEAGPDVWRIEIARIQSSGSECCCGGH